MLDNAVNMVGCKITFFTTFIIILLIFSWQLRVFHYHNNFHFYRSAIAILWTFPLTQFYEYLIKNLKSVYTRARASVCIFFI